jgi:hypothetical protein
LIFTTPRCGESVSLKHWSPQRIPVQNVAAVVDDVIRRSRQVNAAALSLVIPSSERDIHDAIMRLGFLHRRSTAFVQTYSDGKDPTRAAAPWRFTNIHTGFLGFS